MSTQHTWSQGTWEYSGSTLGPRAPSRNGRPSTAKRQEARSVEPQRALFIAAVEAWEVEALPDLPIQHITNLHRGTDSRDLDALLRAVNTRLPVGGTYAGCVETYEHARRRHFAGQPRWRAWAGYGLHFLYRRVLPKLAPTRALYRLLSRGRGHVISKTEILGRLVYCGFEPMGCRETDDGLHFVAEKRRSPSTGQCPSSGLVFRMDRVGKGGHLRSFYKLRTMHPYAEYLQASIHATNALAPNGKFNDDFRVTTWGRFMRRTWLDELPMLVNLVKGDLKLVGVRPLSQHYLSLYPPDLLALRLRHKPGLIPPFYADLPEGFDAICESERRYLKAYERRPLSTDVRYLTRALRRIVFERARSQ